MTTAAPEVLPPVGTAIAEFSVTEQALAQLQQQLADAKFDLTTVAGNQQARQSRLALVRLRTALEAKRKELNADDQERIRMRNDEAKRITAAIVAIELPIDNAIRADEARREAERAERERQEAERLAAINAQIERIRALPLTYVAATAVVLQEAMAEVATMDLDVLFDDIHRPRAQQALDGALEGLGRALEARIAADQEAARLKAEREELERQKEEQAEAQRQADQRAAAARAEADRLAQMERDRLAAEQRALNEAANAELARQAAQQREDEQRLANERAELDRQQAEARRIEAERQQAEAAEREALRIQQEQDRIDRATLLDAAIGAYDHLLFLELGDEVVTRTLHAAITRERAKAVAA